MRYITIGRPSALPPDFLSCYPSHQRPTLLDIQEPSGKGRLHTIDDDDVIHSSVIRRRRRLTSLARWGERLAC